MKNEHFIETKINKAQAEKDQTNKPERVEIEIAQPQQPNLRTHHAICDNTKCKVFPIRGIRYKVNHLFQGEFLKNPLTTK